MAVAVEEGRTGREGGIVGAKRDCKATMSCSNRGTARTALGALTGITSGN
jgi:hypothetical protein